MSRNPVDVMREQFQAMGLSEDAHMKEQLDKMRAYAEEETPVPKEPVVKGERRLRKMLVGSLLPRVYESPEAIEWRTQHKIKAPRTANYRVTVEPEDKK